MNFNGHVNMSRNLYSNLNPTDIILSAQHNLAGSEWQVG